MKYRLLLLVLSLFLFRHSLYQVEAAAPDQLSLTAIPPRIGDEFTLRAKPGETLQTSVRVRNTSSIPLDVTSVAEDFFVEDGSETPIPVSDTTVSNRWSLASWMVLSPSVNTIAPGESATITVVVEVPADALPGGHYAMIAHTPTISDDSPTTPAAGTAVEHRVGTLVYVMVEGPITEAAFVRNLTIPNFTEYGPVPFSFEINNQSDIHIRPQLSVEIYNLFGHLEESIPLETRNIFPLTSRSFSGEWQQTWGWGLYQAKVVASYGTNGQVAIATSTFWLFPITLVLIGVCSILVLIFIWLLIHRYRGRRRQRREVSPVSTTSQEDHEKFDT